MDVSAQLQRRVEELRDLERAHPRPWLKHLLTMGRVHDALCQQVAARDIRHLLSGVCVRKGLKATTEEREFVLVTVEAELAMMAESAELVRELDRPPTRRAPSFAQPVTFAEGSYWSLESFKQQRESEGAYRRYRSAQNALAEHWAFIAEGDVLRYFPSLQWQAILRGVTYASGWSQPEVKQAIRLLGQVRMALQGCHRGLPVGLDLSSVLGTAILSELDDLLVHAVGDESAVRWVDDVTVGAVSPKAGWDILARAEAGPLSGLGLELHPAKSRVVPTFMWELNAISAVAGGPVESVEGDGVERLIELIEAEGGPVPRSRARGVVRGLEQLGLDQEREAEVLADHGAELVLAWPEWKKRLQKLVGRSIPAEFTDRFLESCRRTEACSGWEGEVAEKLLYLDRWEAEVGRKGRSLLRELVGDRRRGERVRVTAGWVLARRAGEYDKAAMDRLNETSVPAARGVIGAAHFAGATLHNFHRRQAALTGTR